MKVTNNRLYSRVFFCKHNYFNILPIELLTSMFLFLEIFLLLLRRYFYGNSNDFNPGYGRKFIGKNLFLVFSFFITRKTKISFLDFLLQKAIYLSAQVLFIAPGKFLPVLTLDIQGSIVFFCQTLWQAIRLYPPQFCCRISG